MQEEAEEEGRGSNLLLYCLCVVNEVKERRPRRVLRRRNFFKFSNFLLFLLLASQLGVAPGRLQEARQRRRRDRGDDKHVRGREEGRRYKGGEGGDGGKRQKRIGRRRRAQRRERGGRGGGVNKIRGREGGGGAYLPVDSEVDRACNKALPPGTHNLDVA